MNEQVPSKDVSKQDCTCGVTCERKGRPFPDDWSWRCRLLPYLQPHPESRAAGWRCFHCNELFVVEIDARNHFGATQDAEPACKIKAAGEFALLTALRNAEERLASRQSDDSDAIRAMHSMQADHALALRREEEKGYARGIEDAKAHPETLGLQRAAHEPPAVPSKFDLAFEVMRLMDREELDTLQSCHFGYVLRVEREKPSPKLYEGNGRTGVFTNCGYHGTASGWIIRDGTKWIATLGSEEEANQYVAFRNAPPPGVLTPKFQVRDKAKLGPNGAELDILDVSFCYTIGIAGHVVATGIREAELQLATPTKCEGQS